MNKNGINKYFFLVLFFFSAALVNRLNAQIALNDSSYFESRGFNLLVFSNMYDGLFSDSKISGIEIIHHDVRTATNGDVRLSPTPEQWDPCPQLMERKVNKKDNSIEVSLSYPDYNFTYLIKVTSDKDEIHLSVILEKPLPKELEEFAGFNLEFLPSAYFEKTFMMNGMSGVFPLYPSGSMERTSKGIVEAKPIAIGKHLVLAPEDPERRISIKSIDSELSLYDGRNKAQNGWFVVRTLIPSGKSGKVIEWSISASTIPNWLRTPRILYSQAGYHPSQKKVAVFEFDKNDKPKTSARLMRIINDGKATEVLKSDLVNWGKYLRYNYSTFDFTEVRESGLYVIEFDSIRTTPIRISKDVYETAWHPTLDVFFPVQMDHMFVNEAYRVWHGASHLDDALQAPINHVHFDLYAQGPTTDSPYKPGEHIPGLNVGGWFDAGDHDIRTQTQYAVVQNLVHVWEKFGLNRDETTVDQAKRYVDIHIPDGKPDLLQQIEHGTLQLLAQHKSVGHAIPGIIVPELSQYTHLGDAVTITDNLIYNPNLKPGESDGFTSGTFDDRWAFTSKSSALNYGSSAALAAASRALKGFNDSLADECLATAIKIWDEEASHEPDMFRHGNTTGGPLDVEKLKSAVELLLSTSEKKYSEYIQESLNYSKDRFPFYAQYFVNAIPKMGKEYTDELEKQVSAYSENLKNFSNQNPFRVPITTGGWAGNGFVINFALTNYLLHKTFPYLIDKEFVYQSLNYLYGSHPGSNISFVSGVGIKSKMVAYGFNRADFSFIAGGIVPGILVLKPDFPENKEDWPFLWGENEYVINLGASYIYLVNAVIDLLNEN